ncbi:MAG TPA: DedA family protein [Fimbriimonadaceae bacterium]|nr:DedA family protein [Fimbriimonadaceae bacterium]HRJ33008.1 DedA family protein [Fimbriimonadaceae bacterium]
MGSIQLGDFDLNSFAADWGFWALVLFAAAIFVQTGFLVGPLVPGNPLLLAIGVLAGLAGGVFSFWIVWPALSLAAWAGNIVNYRQGRWMGQRRLVELSEARPKVRERLAQAEAFFERWGRGAIVGGMFTPFLRSVVPFVAGVSGMDLRTFALSSAVGATIWVGGVVAVGYFLGSQPWIRPFLAWIAVPIVLVVVGRGVWLRVQRRRAPAT